MLKIGSEGPDVKSVQNVLNKEGYGPLETTGVFDSNTMSALQEFQGGHIDADGLPLKPDGEVGGKTWWALTHPHGDVQRSRLPGIMPTGLTPTREAILRAALHEHACGVHEVPDGSNWGGGIEKYGGRPGWAWCCLFFSWVTKKALGNYAMGQSYARCCDVHIKAKAKQWWQDKHNYSPVPGDTFIMLYRDTKGRFNGKGHIGFVLRVSEDGSEFNTIEGNCGNRVKIGKRRMDQASLEGFINFYPVEEQPQDWERGLVSAKSVAKEGTR